MAEWLYSSRGEPIVFIKDSKVFTRNGRFVGRLEGNEVWHGRYKGEILQNNRFLYNTSKGSIIKGTPGTPGSPGIPGIPGSRGSIGLPGGYRDITDW